MNSRDAIEALSQESRRFPPPPNLAAAANAQPAIYEEAEADYLGFWASWARKLEWGKDFTKILEWDEPFARWFGDGEINASVNCLDRHVRAGKGDKVAYHSATPKGSRAPSRTHSCKRWSHRRRTP